MDEDKWKPFLDQDGHIYVKVIGALYGHPLAPMLWYQYMKEKLEILEFQPLLCEPCIFIRTKTLDIIGIHVDDCFIGTKCKGTWDEINQFVKDYYNGEGTLIISDKFDYCNITFEFYRKDKSVYISQESYWKKICDKFKILEGNIRDVPYNYNFIDRLKSRSNADDNDEETKADFLPIIM